jgi:hypothetical protein
MCEIGQSFRSQKKDDLFHEIGYKNIVIYTIGYDTMELRKRQLTMNDKFIEAGVMRMAGIVAGLLVCAFVYVIRESLLSPEEEM